MLIISKFHDYYDTALGTTGTDKTVVYDRKTKVVEKGKYSRHYDNYDSIKTKNNITLDYQLRVVGFCGKLYPLVILNENTNKFGWGNETTTTHYYDHDKLVDRLNELGVKQPKYTWYRPLRGRGFVNINITNPNELREFFDLKTWTNLDSHFLTHKTPVFIVGDSLGVQVNPCLKELKFMKNKDPFSAFQDIYMFISGVLGVAINPMVEISDKDMASKRGHDGKYSFKTPPGSKKRGKK